MKKTVQTMRTGTVVPAGGPSVCRWWCVVNKQAGVVVCGAVVGEGWWAGVCVMCRGCAVVGSGRRGVRAWCGVCGGSRRCGVSARTEHELVCKVQSHNHVCHRGTGQRRLWKAQCAGG